MGWRDEAKLLYFTERKTIVEISEILGKTRKTISIYLSSQDGIEEEKKKRKAENQEKRKRSQKAWEKTRKRGSGLVEAALLKRQHIIDVRVLSSEKF